MTCLERFGGVTSPKTWLCERAAPVVGVRFLQAGLRDFAFSRHRHDTYTVAVTLQGVQEFTYRGNVHRSLPGQVVILHPDEPHDGRPATSAGFAFHSAYIEPSLVADVIRDAGGRGQGLPFSLTPVVNDPELAARLLRASRTGAEPLEADELVQSFSISLARLGRSLGGSRRRKGLENVALARACEFLNENCRRRVSSEELERVCGESRFNIAEAFDRRFGTSPHRYLLMRRLDHVRTRLTTAASLAALAAESGFSDQAHMTRQFKATFGLTPAAYARMHRAAPG